MVSETDKLLNVIKNTAISLKKTRVNVKKCPKARLTALYIKTRIECIDGYWNELKAHHYDLIRIATEEQKQLLEYFIKDEYFEYEESYIQLKTELLEMLPSDTNEKLQRNNSNSNQNQACKVVLPKITLPAFSGAYEEWLSFHDLFSTLIHNNDALSNVQKLHYLKTSVTGEAATRLKHIQITEANYETAWKSMKDRYGNKRMAVDAIMKRFFSQRKITTNTSSHLKCLLDTTVECLEQLKNLKVSTNNWDPVVIFVIVQKLDPENHQLWEEYVTNKNDGDTLPPFEMFQSFLENRFRTLELVEPKKQTKPNLVSIKEKSFHVTTEIEHNKNKCFKCNENHSISHCKEFANYTPLQRSEHVKNNNLCFNCLSYGHSVRHCKVPVNCRLCKGRHHTLLHMTKPKTASQATPDENHKTQTPQIAMHASVDEVKENDLTMIAASHVIGAKSTSLLATAIVYVKSEDNNTTILRALIDLGSQGSFISERATQILKAKRYPVRGTVVGVGSTREDIKQVVQLEVQSRYSQYSLKVKAYVMSKQLTTKIPANTIRTDKWSHLEGLTLADEQYYRPGGIDLLLGVDVYAQIIQNDVVKGPPGSPCAQRTNLGWILFGKVDDTQTDHDSLLVLYQTIIPDEFLKTLWEVDQEHTKRRYTKEEQQCEQIYEETYTRNQEGRFVVALPFHKKEIQSVNGNTRKIAEQRLLHQQKRFEKTKELKIQYNQILEEYLTMQHMEEVPAEEIANKAVYLPHHAVIRNDKETTKVRIVFDASCKGNNNISLNDELMVGPVLQEDLRSIIMRWRMHKICFLADITKMYRMVLTRKEDNDYQRILWKRNDNEKIKDYRLLTVTFGSASAPYLAIKTLRKLAELEQETYPEGARIILEDYYVDDMMSGADTTEEAIEISEQVQTILKKGGFELQKWASNDEEFINTIDVNKRTTKASFDIKLDNIIKALGICWNIDTDEFNYQLKIEDTNTITKRTILADLQRLFDPLGWIAPTIVMAKILIQKLWTAGVGWDDTIDESLRNEWISIKNDLKNTHEIKIQRWMNTYTNERDRITLHGFSDASIKAYAAVVYCRIETSTGQIKTHLVASRTKVAPVKTISLPRLELSGANLLANLLHKVSRALRIPSHQVYAWTDSTIVLAWLLGEPNRWKPFVANRVVDILEHLSNSQWFHVQSNDNPADIASRGSLTSELKNNEIWWFGPSWLSEREIDYTRPPNITTEIEKKKHIQSYVTIEETEEERFLKMTEYKNLNELLRVIVYCRRFLYAKKHPENIENHMCTEELEQALDVCIRQVQEKDFKNEIERLKQNKEVTKTSKIKTLNPYLDKENNILRVGGRLRNANIDEKMKHPVILSKNNELVPLLIMDAHLKTMHGGLHLTITYLLSKYWILGCKSLVKKHMRNCLTCVKQRAMSRHQIMGDLPAVRVTPSRPFSRCGVDYAGPVHVLSYKGRGAKTRKAYICIFICLAVKAVHLELVSDLTSDAFIAAFKRFVARRGRCIEIWSDNGTNFVAANKELYAMWKESGLELPGDIPDHLADEGTQWRFIPPYTPNFAGLAEAGVKSIKQSLRKTLSSPLTFEEYCTVLCQVESCLNSRPLTVVPTDVDTNEDIQVLTPGHFLVGEALITVPDRDYTDVNVSRLTRWQHHQRLVQTFWKRWLNEYLARLNQRTKWLKRTKEFEIGEVVLLKDVTMAPCKWALARIVSKHPGNDNITRVYTVRYKGKLIKRSVSNLCAIPSDDVN